VSDWSCQGEVELLLVAWDVVEILGIGAELLRQGAQVVLQISIRS
jgi:hypothetical protein